MSEVQEQQAENTEEQDTLPKATAVIEDADAARKRIKLDIPADAALPASSRMPLVNYSMMPCCPVFAGDERPGAA